MGSTRNRAQESLLGRAASRRRKISTIALRLRSPPIPSLSPSPLCPRDRDSLVTGRELSASGARARAGGGHANSSGHAVDAMTHSRVSCIQDAPVANFSRRIESLHEQAEMRGRGRSIGRAISSLEEGIARFVNNRTRHRARGARIRLRESVASLVDFEEVEEIEGPCLRDNRSS